MPIRRAAAEALRYEEFDEDCEISVSIVDNEEIREINRQFRSIDRATDVLSFPMLTFAEGEEAESTRMTKSFWGILLFSLGACEGAGGGIRTFLLKGNCSISLFTASSISWATII